MVAQQSVADRRQKISLSLDAATIRYMDAYVAAHPTTNRSRVVEDAMREFPATADPRRAGTTIRRAGVRDRTTRVGGMAHHKARGRHVCSGTPLR